MTHSQPLRGLFSSIRGRSFCLEKGNEGQWFRKYNIGAILLSGSVPEKWGSAISFRKYSLYKHSGQLCGTGKSRAFGEKCGMRLMSKNDYDSKTSVF